MKLMESFIKKLKQIHDKQISIPEEKGGNGKGFNDDEDIEVIQIDKISEKVAKLNEYKELIKTLLPSK